MSRRHRATPHGARRAWAPPLAAALLSPAIAAAQATAAGAARPLEGPSYAPMAMALLLVLAMIGAVAWIVRRMGLAPRAGGGALRLVAQLALGPRERVVIVEAGDRWWLLGVGAGGIRRLGSMPKGEAGTPGPAAAPSFGTLLSRLRSGGTTGPQAGPP